MAQPALPITNETLQAFYELLDFVQSQVFTAAHFTVHWSVRNFPQNVDWGDWFSCPRKPVF